MRLEGYELSSKNGELIARTGQYKGWGVKIFRDLRELNWFFFIWKEYEVYNSLWDSKVYLSERDCIEAAEEWIVKKHQ